MDIEKLIEEGLARYGRGDLDGALVVWEQVLVVDPQNEQATSYVDYVRHNYDLLTGTPSDAADESGSPYAIEDDEYQVEILEGRLSSAGIVMPPATFDPLDEGWAIEGSLFGTEGTIDEGTPDTTPDTPDLPTGEVSLPMPEVTIEVPAASAAEMARESLPEIIREFTDTPSNPVFNSDPTNLKRRDLGFVNAVDQRTTEIRRPLTVTQLEPADEPAPELDMTLRTPPAKAPMAPMPDPGLRPTALDDNTNYGPAPTAPMPLKTPTIRPTMDVELDGIAVSSAPTAELSQNMLSGIAGLQGLDDRKTRDISAVNSREISETVKLPIMQRALGLSDDPVIDRTAPPSGGADRERALAIGAPTRELGLRGQPSISGMFEAKVLRAPAPVPVPVRSDEARVDQTRADIARPFDAIEARSARILDDIDEGAAPGESREDRTRRQISALLERAGDWHKVGELEKAVTAVDLALNADPNSALAQKLIHRNRDTIMSVFQAFLGDLQRAPMLARPLHELASAPIGPRAAFLLSRIDGTLSVDEILDVSGMPRLEAYRYLCQLLLRGIIK